MLTCEQMTALVTEYLEGAMPLPRYLLFQLHLGMCRHCRRYLRQMKLTVAALGGVREPIPEPAMAALLEQFRGWKG
jgi:predicted anti-sigma-YlaC factor YlaD